MDPSQPRPGAPGFATTRWSMVLAASTEMPAQQAALKELCEAYWYPLYAFLRRRGYDAHHAQDLVQDFFATALEKGYIAQADASRGRFRSFLLTSLTNHAAKLKAKANAVKRGGRATVLRLDFEGGEQRYQLEPEHVLTPEALFARRYALTVLARARGALTQRFRHEGGRRLERYELLAPYLSGEGGAPYRVVANRLGMSETAVKVAVHRLRGQLRDALRAEVAQTVDDPAMIDDELRALIGSLSAGA